MTQLHDGDILLVQIDPQDKETVDWLIRGGELLQQLTSGRSPGADESHVALHIDLRNRDERLETAERGVIPGQSRSHLIHMEPAGLIGCPFYADLNGHRERFRVLRCTDRKLAACASQIACELFLGTQQGTDTSYSWAQYGKIGARIIHDMMDSRVGQACSYGLTAVTVASTIWSGGLVGLAAALPRLIGGTAISLGTRKVLEYVGSEAAYVQQHAGEFDPERKAFALFEQFHAYYDMQGQRRGNIHVSEVCSSFAILAYQLAYVKLVRYFGHPGLGNIGPRRIQSPMGLRDLFLESGLFTDAGFVEGAYDTVNPTGPARTTYDREYQQLLQRRMAEFPLANRQGAAEAPF